MKNVIFAATLTAIMPTFALAQTTVLPTINICSGKEGGNYDFVADTLASYLKKQANVININTTGSMDNLSFMNDKKCDVILVQSDAQYVWQKEKGKIDAYNIKSLFTEYVNLLCRRDSEIESLDDLNGKKLFVGEYGTGSEISIRGMLLADKEKGGNDYKDIALIREGGNEASLIKLVAGVADCMITTSAPSGKFLSISAEKLGDSLVLVSIEDKDFNDVTITDNKGKEKSVWNPTEIPSKAYDKIMPRGLIGRKSVNTFGVTADILISTTWADTNPELFGSLGFAIEDLPAMLKNSRGVELEK
jgi:TRAP transporter TAXI family solute receptor